MEGAASEAYHACKERSDGLLLDPLQQAFYAPLTASLTGEWLEWLQRWREQLLIGGEELDVVAARMRRTSPKYVPREWMLADSTYL